MNKMYLKDSLNCAIIGIDDPGIEYTKMDLSGLYFPSVCSEKAVHHIVYILRLKLSFH